MASFRWFKLGSSYGAVLEVSAGMRDEGTGTLTSSGIRTKPAKSGHAADAIRLALTGDASYQRSQFGLAIGTIGFSVAAALLQVVSVRGILHWPVSSMLAACALLCFTVRTAQARHGVLSFYGHMLVHLMVVTAVLFTLTYLGPFTPIVIGLCPFVFIAALDQSLLKGRLVYLLASLGYIVVAMLFISGLLDVESTPIGMRGYNLKTMIALTVVVEGILFNTYLVACRTRRVTLNALKSMAYARQELDRQEVQLDEARADLHRAVAGGRVGSRTGKRIGNYRAGELIGRGGMGSIYRAWPTIGDRPVAIKLLSESLSAIPQQVERFFREALISSELNSPHIVKVIDRGWDEDHPYIVMELLEGHDLQHHLSDRGRLSLSETVNLIREIASALHTAHRSGIIHRDIKPSNLFLDMKHAQPIWKVIDFGASKLSSSTGTLTGGGLIGTPGYMPPEQLRGEQVDQRTDVFALGVIAYQALTGTHPFPAADARVALFKVLVDSVERPSALINLNHDVELVLALALAKDKRRRLETVEAFANALMHAAENKLPDELRIRALMLLEDNPWSDDPISAASHALTEAHSTNAWLNALAPPEETAA